MRERERERERELTFDSDSKMSMSSNPSLPDCGRQKSALWSLDIALAPVRNPAPFGALLEYVAKNLTD